VQAQLHFVCLAAKFSEGGRWIRLGCKMGCCMKKVENHWSRV